MRIGNCKRLNVMDESEGITEIHSRRTISLWNLSFKMVASRTLPVLLTFIKERIIFKTFWRRNIWNSKATITSIDYNYRYKKNKKCMLTLLNLKNKLSRHFFCKCLNRIETIILCIIKYKTWRDIYYNNIELWFITIMNDLNKKGEL